MTGFFFAAAVSIVTVTGTESEEALFYEFAARTRERRFGGTTRCAGGRARRCGGRPNRVWSARANSDSSSPKDLLRKPGKLCAEHGPPSRAAPPASRPPRNALALTAEDPLLATRAPHVAPTANTQQCYRLNQLPPSDAVRKQKKLF